MLTGPEAEAERQHHVRAPGEGLLESAANRQRMFFGNRALARAPRIYGNRSQLDELLQLRRRVGPEQAVAASDQGTLCRVQQLDRAIDLVGVAGRTHIV